MDGFYLDLEGTVSLQITIIRTISLKCSLAGISSFH